MYPKTFLVSHRKALWSLAILLIVVLICSYSIKVKSNAYSDSMVRAAVIFGILRFTSWPDEKDHKMVINLCTYGSSPTTRALSRLKKTPKAGNKTVTLKLNVAPEDLPSCHVVVAGKDSVIGKVLTSSTLFICDECEARDGDIFAIHLVQQDRRIQFRINLDRISEQELNLSASLIELAESCYSSDPNIRACDDKEI